MQATGRLRAPDPREAPPNGEKTNGPSGSRHAGLKPTKSRSDRTNARPTVRQATAPGNTVGRTERVLIDSRQGDYYVGRTQYDSPEVDQEILIPASEKRLLRGRFYDVRIDSAADYDLYGRAAGK